MYMKLMLPTFKTSKAYWLGALAADGCLYYNHNKWVLQFIVSEKDQDWLLSFRDEIKSTHPIRILPGGFGTPFCGLVVTNQMFCAPLLAIGLKSADILQRIPEDLYAHFIRCGFTTMFGNGQYEEIDKYVV